eukprot:2272528-Rhodomonas_salina.5
MTLFCCAASLRPFLTREGMSLGFGWRRERERERGLGSSLAKKGSSPSERPPTRAPPPQCEPGSSAAHVRTAQRAAKERRDATRKM